MPRSNHASPGDNTIRSHLRLHLAILACVLIGAVILHGNLQRLEMRGVAKVHASMVAPSLWDVTPQESIGYIRLAAIHYGYESFIVLDHTGTVFIEERSKTEDKWHTKILLALGLIPRLHITEDIFFQEYRIGRLEVVWRDTSIHVYAYITFVGLLVALALRLHAQVKRHNAELETKVRVRTTALNAANHELRKSSLRFKTLFESANDAIVVFRERQVMDCNQKALEMFGYPREQMIGIAADRIVSGEQTNGGHLIPWINAEESLEITSNTINRLTEWRCLRRDGATFEAETAISAVELENEQCLQVIIRDITERKRTHNQLAILAAAMEQAAEDIVITDTNGIIEYVNPAFEETTGYSRAEAIGHSPRILKSGKHDNLFYNHLWSTIKKGEIWSGLIVNRRKDGALIQEDSTISPVYDAFGMHLGYVSVRRDVTQQLKTEAMLRQTQKMEALGAMAGGIAHDFNNILAGIFGYTEIALAIDDQEKQRQHLHSILEAAKRARDLVKHILTFSRQREVTPQPVQVKMITKETLKLIRASLPTTIEIRQNIISDGVVLADPTQIHQVLMNLFTNAGHAMRERGGVLEVGLVDVELGQDFISQQHGGKPGKYIKLTVSDTGHGMPPEVREHIFEPFFTTKQEGEGTGMGLAVVHGIVKNCEGMITVYSEPGKGATFTVFLPEIEAERPEEYIVKLSLPTGVERILVVDDEPEIVTSSTQMLSMLGYRATPAAGSLEALELFKSNPDGFDLLLTDMTMPHLTGTDLAQAILAIRPHLPVVICTGFANNDTRQRITDARLAEVLTKPLTMSQLANTIRRVLDTTLPDRAMSPD